MKAVFKWIGGATWTLSLDGLKIACDPVLCKAGTVQDYFWFRSRRLNDPSFTDSDFEGLDLWLLTHGHEDHLDTQGLKVLSGSERIVADRTAARKLQQAGHTQFDLLEWNDRKTFKIHDYSLVVEAVPAIHGVNPVSAFFAGHVNGYYITVKKGEEKLNIYVTADTVYKELVVRAVFNKPIDLMIANVGGAKKGTWMSSLTLTSKMLKRFWQALHPKLIIPVHHGTFSHYNEPVERLFRHDDMPVAKISVGEEMEIG